MSSRLIQRALEVYDRTKPTTIKQSTILNVQTTQHTITDIKPKAYSKKGIMKTRRNEGKAVKKQIREAEMKRIFEEVAKPVNHRAENLKRLAANSSTIAYKKTEASRKKQYL
ncbi:hypothetical protein SARC_03722 [Sphaeroforma arctica JP610]|uniref:Uncharacterized protein n=1 Tax=Sphaeroforma arctica JP610 TaxID=667725 RepID=A0A0L0G4X3_9EUKA|nr:hypothetical protein SARC_03722 [Sphaeroforma arctica JP610]KNC84060.1 hypothetical protein SARC_03722 [Sphaeroforma arctica JP610]|eukprot:XP_014157962.1 hypothetical protein SARC_03722 [Sphaeroforma arctica JP610]